MLFHHCFYVCGLFAFLHKGCTAAPSMTMSNYNSSDAVRPSSSTGGLVDGVDSYVFKGVVSRLRADEADYSNENIEVDFREIGTTPWNSLQTCTNIHLCPPPVEAGCYCESSDRTTDPETFNMVVKNFANKGNSGYEIRLRWVLRDEFSQINHATSNEVNFPTIYCDPVTVSCTAENEPVSLSAGEVVEVTKSQSTSNLVFSVENLLSSYTIKIEQEGSELASVSAPGTEASTVVLDSQIGKDFNLSYSEGSTSGCGRSEAYLMKFKEPSDDDDVELIIIIVVVVILGLFLCGVIAGVCIGFKKTEPKTFSDFIKNYFAHVFIFVVMCILILGLGFMCGAWVVWHCSRKNKQVPKPDNQLIEKMESKPEAAKDEGKQVSSESKSSFTGTSVDTESRSEFTLQTGTEDSSDLHGDVSDGFNQSSNNKKLSTKKRQKQVQGHSSPDNNHQSKPDDKPLGPIRNAPPKVQGGNTTDGNSNGRTQSPSHDTDPPV